jgi:hypothetical protein
MGSALDEAFLTKVNREIDRQLRNLKSDFAQNIAFMGCPSLEFGGKYGFHANNGCFAHEEATYPGVVIEVSYPEKRRYLGYLADDCILGSNGNIRAVVGLDIVYQGQSNNQSKKATLSIWKPNITVDKGQRTMRVRQEVVDLVAFCFPL